MVVFSLALGLLGAAVYITICRIKSEIESQILAVGLVIAALLYLGFAVFGTANSAWIFVEAAGIGIYSLFAMWGLYYSRWWLMVGWLLHPVWDLWLHFFEQGASFTPAWYALGCMSFDLLIAAYIFGVQLGTFNSKVNLKANLKSSEATDCVEGSQSEKSQPPVNSTSKRQLLLKILLTACVVSTAIHFIDNYLYIEQYPQPDWITPSSVYVSWIGWTMVGIVGYWLYKNQRFWLAYLCLVFYSFCGLDSLGHYLYGGMSEFSPKMHFFILTDGVVGFALLGFTLWSSLILREQFKEPGTGI
ncbi:DUF6010 family protein [Leptolyngbya ohadii]|uniref:DUF6010 family protein n=1 Tax=Leptolyngbya ohadii TaxID=1962290 RepID=UPI0019D4E9AA|nr:DUF6010 family protein [Leptolyngbya ohadii]